MGLGFEVLSFGVWGFKVTVLGLGLGSGTEQQGRKGCTEAMRSCRLKCALKVKVMG